MAASKEFQLYSNRNGVGIAEDLRTIQDDPEIYLATHEQEELRAFADGLMTGEAEGINTEADESFEEIFRRSITSNQESFYLQYFMTEDGAQDRQLLGDGEDITSKLLDVNFINENLTSKQRKEVAARSRDWYKAHIANLLASDLSQDSLYVDEPELAVSYDPDALLSKFDDLQKYRQFYRKVKTKVKEEQRYEERLNQAKVVILDRYMRRVNGLVAELYPDVFALAEQLQASGDTQQVAEWKNRLAASAPTVAHLYDSYIAERLDNALDSDNDAFDNFAERLDSFRNGAQQQEEGFSPISRELAAYVEHTTDNPKEVRSSLPAEVLKRLDGIELDSKGLSDLMTAVISEWQLLSEYSATWDEVDDRSGPAPDKLFQVVITPKKKSLAVNSEKRVVFVPDSFKRTLTQASPAGGLLVAAHELAHVKQAMFDEELGNQIALARIKGRQYVTLREAGGKYQERKILEEHLGRSYSPNLHYLRALRGKLAGDNVVQVARAFYDSYSAQNNPDHNSSEDQKARELAADRVLRLYRYGGHNSQPLDYIEQELVVDQLASMDEHERSAFLLAAGSFNTHDAAMLRKVGVLELPKAIDSDPAGDVMRIFMRDFYPSYESLNPDPLAVSEAYQTNAKSG